MLTLYNLLLSPLRLAVVAWSARPRAAASRREWSERRGRGLPAIAPGGVWLHGASVGEARLVRALARGLRLLRPGLPIAVSAVTPAGRRSLPGPPEIDAAFFAPLDFAGWPSRVFRAIRPSVFVLLETELWPNLLAEATALAVPVVVANGRISRSKMARHRALGTLLAPSLARVAAVGARTGADGQRFRDLGVPAERILVTGDLKYDVALPEASVSETRRRLQVPDGPPVLVAGSTGAGEEAAVLDAFAAARAERPDLLLVLAPRHIERAPDVAREIARRGFGYARVSEGGPPPPGAAVRLLDTIGDLGAAYRIASIAFVGGSLVPIGGHNVLEPASAGVPVLFGPHVDNVSEAAAALERSGGGRRVRDARELADAVVSLLADDAARRVMAQRAEDVVRAHGGALERTVAMVLQAVDRGGR